MRWRRLGWAGLELEASGESVVIDHLLDPGVFHHLYTEDRDELITPEAGRGLAALVTHLHLDHTDATAIGNALAPEGIVLRPPRKATETSLDEVATGEAEAALAGLAQEKVSLAPGERIQIGPFHVTALFASDGLGSPQVSWLVGAGDKQVLHAGDTMWHGAWWDIAAEHGRIDLACLPGNGAEVRYPQWEPPVTFPAVMTPEQSVDAARALKARTLVPIHFNRTFEHPDFYRPVADAEARIAKRSADLGLAVSFATPGDWCELS